MSFSQDLSQKSLEEAIAYVAQFTRDRGERIAIKPTNVTYVEFRRRPRVLLPLAGFALMGAAVAYFIADLLGSRR